VASFIRPNTRLIVMLHASNVLGAILPVADIGRIAADHGLYFLVDAAQTAGTYPIDVQAMHIDLLAFAGHKGTFGPHGTGGLVVRPGILLEPLIEGGTGGQSELETQPDEYPEHLESGTPNAAGIAGLLAGVEFVLAEGVEQIRSHEVKLAGRLITALQQIPGLRLYGPADAQSRVGVVAINVEGYDPTQLAVVLDEMFDVAVRAGLHCAPQAHRIAGTIEYGSLRFSPGYFSTVEDIDEAVAALQTIVSTT
jgi:selenocysteine lyase/cysteine desulfurase